MSRWTLAAVLMGGAAVAYVSAQPPSAPTVADRGPVIVPAQRHDVSGPLRSVPPALVAAGNSGKHRQIKEPGPIRVGRGPRGQRMDTAVQDYPQTPLMPFPSLTFEGINNVDGVLPPDTNGDVGPNHYVQWVNLSLAIWSKGSATTLPTLLYGPAPGSSLWRGFGGPCEADNNGDPIVIYDHLADRWFMSQLALPNIWFGFLFAPFYQCIAVSATPDPTGAYYRYQFSFNKLNDYGKFGLWPDAYYMAINQFQALSLQWAGQGVVAFDRNRMLNGQSASMVYFDLASVDMTLGGMLPSHLAGPAPPAGSPNYYVQMDDDAWGYSPDQLQVWQFHVDWAHPASSSFTRGAATPTAPFDSDLCGHAENCIPQPTGVGVDSMSDRLMYRLQYHNFGDHESLVVNHSVDVDGLDHAGIRWYEIRSPGNNPTIHQQGTYAPDAEHRWMGSAAMDRLGNIALGYSVSSASTSPSIRYTGRLADDPPGVMTQGEADLMVGAGSQTHSSGRWGDYSLLAVDPVDQCTFWYTQEYYAATSEAGWQTRIGSFAFPSCSASADTPHVAIAATSGPAKEAGLVKGTVTVTRTGDLSAPLDVHYQISGSAVAGVDYVPMADTITLGPGAASATIDVMPIDDSLVETDENVVLSVGWDAAYIVGIPGSASVSIVSDDVPPDLIVSAFTSPVVGGSGAAITVNDTVKNQGGGPSDPSTTAFYLSVNGLFDAPDIELGTRAVPALAPGAVNSGPTTLTIPANTAVGSYYIIAWADASSAIAETLENNNTRATGPVRIGPDLTVSSLTVPPVAGGGDTISVSDITANIGGGDAGPSRTALYLSTNLAYDAADQLIGGRDIGTLGVSGTSSATTPAVIPSGLPGGLYYVLARADHNNAVVESLENNNVRASAAIKIGPDLTVSSLTVPSLAGNGDTISVSDVTANIGGGAAGPSRTALYISTNIAYDAADQLIGGRDIGPLGVNGTSSASTPAVIPSGLTGGLYYVLALADQNNAVVESQENNNVRASAAIKIGPDLVVSTLTVPAGAGAGGTVTISDTTKNQGAGSPTATSMTAFYLSTNTAFDAADRPLGSRAVMSLGAGQTQMVSTTLQIPIDVATGQYFILAQADVNNQVVESVEWNNVAFAPMKIGPDLTETALSVSGTAVAGGSINVTETTKNIGGGAAGASTTRFYLSSNGLFDANDVLICSRDVGPLGAGATSVATTPCTIPAGTPAGNTFLIGVVDGGNSVQETVETNNTLAVWFRIN